MPAPKCGDTEFISLFESHGPYKLAKLLGLAEDNVFKRRRRLELKYKRRIRAPNKPRNEVHERYAAIPEHPGRLHAELTDGNLLLGTDSHYIPGVVTDAHKAFVRLAGEIKPAIIIKNGDELDFSAISRFTPIGWEHRPPIVNEIEWAGERLEEIRQASKNTKFYWPLGNHDARYETRLATQVPEYAKVHGMHLKDHFHGWSPCWSLWINSDVVVKHRFKGGITAARQNTLLAGKHVFTGHTHRMVPYFFADYNGMRFGMECGTMADPYGPQFTDYTEDNPREWIQGFVLLTFHKGKLLPPEPIVCPGNGTYQYRGRVYEV